MKDSIDRMSIMKIKIDERQHAKTAYWQKRSKLEGLKGSKDTKHTAKV